jgi:hypothetical protein
VPADWPSNRSAREGASLSDFVPCDADGRSSWAQITDLDGVSFVLTFSWSQREGRWVLAVRSGGRMSSCCINFHVY